MNSSENTFCVILLAGGMGSRMKTAMPKQFLPLGKKAVALHSFDIFTSLPYIKEIVVVCEEDFRSFFSISNEDKLILSFAKPGARRQDSVHNGLKAQQSTSTFICIHDAARPFVTREVIERTLNAATIHNAVTCATQIKFTLRETDPSGAVINTPDRSKFWEIQTPQVIKRTLLEKGFDLAIKNNTTVTDDVALVELLGEKVHLVEGCYSNIKLTTQEDLAIAGHLMNKLIN